MGGSNSEIVVMGIDQPLGISILMDGSLLSPLNNLIASNSQLSSLLRQPSGPFRSIISMRASELKTSVPLGSLHKSASRPVGSK